MIQNNQTNTKPLNENDIEIIRLTNEIAKLNQELANAYIDSIETLRTTVEAKDPYTRGHSDRVSAYSVLLGRHLGLAEEDFKTLQIAGLFHDIGKIGITDNILLKNEKLTEEEYSEIKHHPEIGVTILSKSKIFTNILPIVQHHHEKYDGSGYPGRLIGNSIPFLARIVCIADSFDAMATRRPYRYSISIELIKHELEKNKGSQFDPSLCDTFIKILENNFDSILEIQNKY
ncbi:MAG TPA: HD-GYP domain-containing protein [Clostridia bacterium]|mgnify:CR=1 FL=1|nr:HD-GYP domain-containing protein [Clostridia bacterium]